MLYDYVIRSRQEGAMSKFVHVGDFCPNKECPDYGKAQANPTPKNIKKSGKTAQGRQRYQCLTCGQTFVETKGTLFYRRRTPEKEILDTLASVAEGSRVSSLARTTGHKEDTIAEWLKAAAEQAAAVEEVLLADYQLKRGQLDALWSYVGHKGEKKGTSRPPTRGNSGAPPCST
jgi:transposase-like protein